MLLDVAAGPPGKPALPSQPWRRAKTVNTALSPPQQPSVREENGKNTGKSQRQRWNEWK